ncbi:MAG: OmpA/MotB family protein [Anaerovoracaceae bacterium]|jgi:chemotaxis protein MotB
MARRKKKKGLNKDAWLATYADMVTLILVFFVLLYSMSSIDQEKYRLLVKAFTADPETLEQLRLEESELQDGDIDMVSGMYSEEGVAEIEDLEDLFRYLKGYVDEHQLNDSVEVQKGQDAVFVRFMSSLFFYPDRADLRPEGQEVLSAVGDAIEEVEPTVKVIRIDGHTAEADRGVGMVDDRELSTDRANRVLSFLEDNHIKDPSKLMAVGYGMHRPVAPNDSEANRAKNRRVELLIAKNDPIQDQLNRIYQLEDRTEVEGENIEN